jgi:hypothetical protein
MTTQNRGCRLLGPGWNAPTPADSSVSGIKAPPTPAARLPNARPVAGCSYPLAGQPARAAASRTGQASRRWMIQTVAAARRIAIISSHTVSMVWNGQNRLAG